MSGVPFGWLSKKEPVIVPNVTDEQAEAILSGEGRIYCEAYRCNMKEIHCADFYKKAKANAKNYMSETGSTHRRFCLGCETGKLNSKNIKARSLSCETCGRDLDAGEVKKKRTVCRYCQSSSSLRGIAARKRALKG